jgi:predicted HTH domain antitoxin
MRFDVELPDDLMQHSNPARVALEALAIEGYRSEALSHAEASRLLSLSRFEFEGFLKDRQITEHAYGLDDLVCDLESIATRRAVKI